MHSYSGHTALASESYDSFAHLANNNDELKKGRIFVPGVLAFDQARTSKLWRQES